MIYLDNASTSFHKPDCVFTAVMEAMHQAGNSGRGSSGEAMEASHLIFDTRCRIAEMFEADGPECVAFTSNATEALNTALFGVLHPGDGPVHAIATEMDHNSVLRPLYALEKKGLELTVLPADRKGRISLTDMEAAIRPETKVIVCTHASNLTGNRNDIHAIGEIAKKHDILFIADAAQTAGVFPISMKKDQIDILCFSGHKGLMGPQGTGVICVRPGVKVEPLKVGGSGILTFQKEHPSDMPEALEAGTLNSHGIAGLRAALGWIQETGIDRIRQREQDLMMRFYEQVKTISGVTVYGDFSQKDRSPVVTLNIMGMGSSELSMILGEDYGISTRSGGHCAPLMHQALGTEKTGAVRFSFSCFNTEEEVDEAARAVKEIAEEE
ncbi:aminotransferase class V-fold PLP-dependent enzyme [Blautia schinkii]|uniref:aminotransferase class V-fold PLP-dependent enzyme n=1 Tax=Blautia schinkii TaxID=180164 RepID=UPI00157003F1|nr:aminotransferase class V-fold PLP-dependent enzyme [Blautia schinkii]NSG81119.1 aminotransferase class V-fold PLP-dependent enzyme [Blautia schinkii]NSK21718.1 aminotransferase class V-fold PLP-dependent enzyme [Blautia schinkii]NSK24761.1 aminotransferase class V-fold PLP-dependent enzyme [Blautia schinkii]NSK31425.1 aminotransferase class V-fold PLP-dependent enzyme [Blautia schinkii]NSK48142.1 aminotransferase class V-fold PLP-dependent enzyme [Blautia schinkii]